MKTPFLLCILFLLGLRCAPSESIPTVKPDMLVITDDDSLRCRILRGEILTMHVRTEHGDSVEIDNSTVTRIIHLTSGRDITTRYIDREALRVELAKKKAIERREKLRADVVAGLKKSSELQRVPISLLSTRFLGGKPPKIELAILNLGTKKIELVKVRVRCFDASGKPSPGIGGRDHLFQATSRIPIEPDEDFTTVLTLRNHPNTKKARVEIHYLEFADNTWWKGEVAATVEP